MAMDEVVERAGGGTSNKWVGIYVGILAVLLAICNVGGANATKDAMRAHIEAANTWSFYQAKNIRRNTTAIAADDLDLMQQAMPAMPPELQQKFKAKVADYRAEVQRLTTDPEKKEGMNELMARGRGLEGERDTAFRRDPYFDWSQALLQIAIVLASVHLIVNNGWLLGLSGLLAGSGVLLMVNGFTLLVRLPFLA
jgi:Domain of unknown function (DUF4337)